VAVDERLTAAEAEIARRTRQQAALAELGQAALTRADVGLLVGQTCALVEWALSASYVSVVEASGNELALRFGLGFNQTFSHCNDAAPEHTPLLLCTLTLNEPMTFRNRGADPRVNRDHLFGVHHVEAGACLPIPGRERAFGLLTVYTDDDRTFAADEVEFLRAIADITGAIIISTQTEEARKQAEDTLQQLAYRDTLTDLPNRFLFQDRLDHALEQARRRGNGVAIMYVDLDRFKVVNDTLGHTVGDHLLQVVAKRLRDVLRSDDTIARLGGDEFAVILPEVQRAEDAGSVARKLIAAVRETIRVDGHELHVTASAGISMYPTDGEDVVTLVKHADAALYRSKELGRNTVQLFASTMNRRYTERLELELSLHRAIEREEFTLVYQPICDRQTRRVRSFEALIRWNRPGHGMVNPAEFIEIAEETRLILPIGDWVMRTACTQLREWREQGIDGFSIGVNLSAHQIAQPHFIHSVHDTLLINGLKPHDLELELTESAALQNLEWTLSVLDQLRSLGVGIAVDDFGTGQSSLVYLKRFPITTLKIDREFLRDVQREASDAAIFRSIVELGHSLGLYVVAEGIETHADRELVERQQCDGMQGYHFSRPLPAEDVPAWMRAFNYPASVVA